MTNKTCRTRKVVLILVEGPSDRKALKLLKKYINKSNPGFSDYYTIYFEETKGDVTTRKEYIDIPNESRFEKVKTEISYHVQTFIKDRKFLLEDIAIVFHLLDMDGAYIPDEWICPMTEAEKSSNKPVLYYDKSVHARLFRKAAFNPPCELHKGKRFAMDHLLLTYRIKVVSDSENKTIPYRLFFMSCNLEHFFYGERNFPDNEKEKQAENLEKTYSVEEYMSFLKKYEMIEMQEYGVSWYYIRRRNENSLSRCSNVLLISDFCREMAVKLSEGEKK